MTEEKKNAAAYNLENNYAFFAHLTNQCNSDAKNGNSQKENQRPNKAETHICFLLLLILLIKSVET